MRHKGRQMLRCRSVGACTFLVYYHTVLSRRQTAQTTKGVLQQDSVNRRLEHVYC